MTTRAAKRWWLRYRSRETAVRSKPFRPTPAVSKRSRSEQGDGKSGSSEDCCGSGAKASQRPLLGIDGTDGFVISDAGERHPQNGSQEVLLGTFPIPNERHFIDDPTQPARDSNQTPPWRVSDRLLTLAQADDAWWKGKAVSPASSSPLGSQRRRALTIYTVSAGRASGDYDAPRT